MNVSCPDCKSVFRVDPAKVPIGGVRARCSVCGGVISVPAKEFTTGADVRTPGAQRVSTPPAMPLVPASSPMGTAAPAATVRSATPSTLHDASASHDARSPRDASTPRSSSMPPTPTIAASVQKAAPVTRDLPEADAPEVFGSDAEAAPEPLPYGEDEPVGQPGRARPSRPPAATPTAEADAGQTRPASKGLRPAAPATRPVTPSLPIRAPFNPLLRRPLAGGASGAPMAAPPFKPPGYSPLGGAPEAAAPPATPAPQQRAEPHTPPPPATVQRAGMNTPAPPAPRAGINTPSSSVHAGAPQAGTTTPVTGGQATRRPINPFLASDPNLKAKRLARALVSDMVTYLPQKREEGLKNNTLKALFRDEIKKSYEEYVDQIGKEIAESTTHFQDALNDVLSGGKRIF